MNSNAKGKAGERELARVLRSYGIDAHRGVQYHGGPDSPDVIGLDGIHIEVKRTEELRLYQAMEQSIRDSGDGEIPAVFHRRNNKGWLVILRLEDFMDLYMGGGGD